MGEGGRGRLAGAGQEAVVVLPELGQELAQVGLDDAAPLCNSMLHPGFKYTLNRAVLDQQGALFERDSGAGWPAPSSGHRRWPSS